ncbi:hypothetical protein DAMA08_029970 [Martiniozyma asiatica (nom. inval.)]|nr:hypothetical protein DAMA08_029970 [Martiniozyma asiatica]
MKRHYYGYMEPNLKIKFLNEVGKWAKLRYSSMDSEHYWKQFCNDGITHGESLSPTRSLTMILKISQRRELRIKEIRSKDTNIISTKVALGVNVDNKGKGNRINGSKRNEKVHGAASALKHKKTSKSSLIDKKQNMSELYTMLL